MIFLYILKIINSTNKVWEMWFHGPLKQIGRANTYTNMSLLCSKTDFPHFLATGGLFLLEAIGMSLKEAEISQVNLTGPVCYILHAFKSYYCIWSKFFQGSQVVNINITEMVSKPCIIENQEHLLYSWRSHTSNIVPASIPASIQLDNGSRTQKLKISVKHWHWMCLSTQILKVL